MSAMLESSTFGDFGGGGIGEGGGGGGGDGGCRGAVLGGDDGGSIGLFGKSLPEASPRE